MPQRHNPYHPPLDRKDRTGGSAATATSAAAIPGARARCDAAESDVGCIPAEERRQIWTGDGSLSAGGFQSKRVIVCGIGAGTAKRMTLREAHGSIGCGCAG